VRPVRTHLEVLSAALALDGSRIVDVGCGDGSLTHRLAEAGAWVVGVDTSVTAIERASARTGDHEAYLVAAAEQLPLPAGSVDAVTFLNSLHHVASDALLQALGEARRVVRPQGVVYVQEPLAEGAYYDLVRVVDNEDEVRAAAQRALREAERIGLVLDREFEYDATVRYRGFDSFRQRMVLTDQRRASRLADRADELEHRFYRVARRESSGWTFRQPTRATLLRRADQREKGQT
jgi:SAM-dependent methyltransferase